MMTIESDMAGKLHSVAQYVLRSSTIVGIAFAAVAWSTPAGAESVDQLYAKAKAEKSLVIRAADPIASYESAARAFEQQFPGINVSLKGVFSNVLNKQIEQQFSVNKVETDLVILQTIQEFLAWDRRGLLLKFKPESFNKIGVGYKDGNGAWIAVARNPIFYGYNPENVSPGDVPKSALDFLKSRFKGRLISAYPSDNDASLYIFSNIVRQYGWGYMDHYMKQQPRFVQGHLSIARSLGSGESLVSFDTTVSSALNVQHAGGKIALAGPTDEFLPVFFTAEAILKDAPHPNAASLFVSWFLSKEWQSRIREYSSRFDVQMAAGLPPLSGYRLMDHYLEFVTDENQLIDLRKRFETYTGPVKNAGGLN